MTVKYRINTDKYIYRNIYCNSHVIHDGIVEGDDVEGHHFVVTGNYVVEELK